MRFAVTGKLKCLVTENNLNSLSQFQLFDLDNKHKHSNDMTHSLRPATLHGAFKYS